jgi:hypothetical protein
MMLALWANSKGVSMSKPKGWGEFDKLARRVVAVPKEAVDAKIKADKIARRKKRKSK